MKRYESRGERIVDSLFGFCSRKKPMGLLVALGDDGKARGELFWDDGESIGESTPLTGYVFVVVIADKS